MPYVQWRDERSPEERIRDRLKPTCPEYWNRPIAPDAQTTVGNGPTRCHTDCFYGATQGQHGGVSNPVYRGLGASSQGTYDDESED